ncbi:MAG: SRPBCC domain-containing protein [Bacteroidota bacterium]|nr:SRPBCC domain-containing protein [Bacteroidota bacterium]
MEQKTKINAEDGKQDLVITREFDLPLELLFKAHAEPELLVQWMSNPYTTAKALKFDGKKHGSYQLESTDANGKVVFKSNGTFHEFISNKKIIRTFEMENAPMGVQLEIYEFEKLTDDTSKLNMHVIFESVAIRDQLLKMPFAQGINMAHDRIQEILNKPA